MGEKAKIGYKKDLPKYFKKDVLELGQVLGGVIVCEGFVTVFIGLQPFGL